MICWYASGVPATGVCAGGVYVGALRVPMGESGVDGDGFGVPTVLDMLWDSLVGGDA